MTAIVQETDEAVLQRLLADVRACTVCAAHLPLGPLPVVRGSTAAPIMIISQAPGTAVHRTGLSFNDPSGDRLRSWLDVDRDTFYDETRIAMLPMGFCYPGTGKSGDLPPRPECAPAWRRALLDRLPETRLTLLIGQYAHAWHIPGARRAVTENVRQWQQFWPDVIPMPHPSPRNNLWLRKNPWFEAEVVPAIQARVASILN